MNQIERRGPDDYRKGRNSAFHIAAAIEEDWEWIVPRYAETAWASMRTERKLGTEIEAVRRQLEEQIARIRGPEGSSNQAYVAKDRRGAIAGFIWVMKSTSGFTGQSFAWEMCVYVEQNTRGQGLGHRLMKMAEGWARQQGVNQITLNVSSKNDSARGLYQSLGYETETIRMTKRLATS